MVSERKQADIAVVGGGILGLAHACVLARRGRKVVLFERHDRSRFEVHGYCCSPEDGSDTRRRIIAAFDRFTRVDAMSDEQLAHAIRQDEIDILIDLNGLTANTRIFALRWRPAPVRVWLLLWRAPSVRFWPPAWPPVAAWVAVPIGSLYKSAIGLTYRFRTTPV